MRMKIQPLILLKAGLTLFAVAIIFVSVSANSFVRAEGKNLNVIYLNSGKEAELIMMQTLQGIVAQTNPEIYIDSPISTEGQWVGGYDVWLDNLKNYGYNYTRNNDPWWYIDNYKSQINGYILYDLHQHSANVAETLAGVLKAVAIDSSLEATAEQHGLTLVLDVRGKDEHWLCDSSGYWDQINHSELLQTPLQDSTNAWAWGLADYAAYGKYFKLSENGGLTQFMLNTMDKTNQNSPVATWNDAGEGSWVTAASQHNLYTTSIDHARNLSVLSQIQVPYAFRQATHTADISGFSKSGVHYVTFVVSDGDNVHHVLSDMNDTDWYGNAARGNYNIGWEISPSLLRYAPSVLDWYYKHASITEGKKDNFVAAVSGIGYIFPESYPDLANFVKLTNNAVASADMRIVTVLSNSSSFDQAKLCDIYTAQPNISGVLLKGPGYKTWAGKMVLSNGKPCVTDKENLYGTFGQTTKDQLVYNLNHYPKDPTSPSGYTYVNIGPWYTPNDPTTPDNMTAISLDRLKTDVIDKLDPNVKVVTPEEFIQLISANVYGINKLCNPGVIQGCKICNADGSAWVDTNSRCASGQTCSSGVCVSSCAPKACASLGYVCGTVSDGCGNTLTCGTCSGNQSCQSGACAASCVAKTCSSLGYSCGSQSDGCGNTLNCGACDSGETCSNGNCIATAVNPPAVNITANNSRNSITVVAGVPVTLSWTSSNADTCRASGDWSGNLAMNGSQTIAADNSKTYTIACSNSSGSSSASIMVNIQTIQTNPSTNPDSNTATQKPVTQMSRSEILAAIAQIQALIADLQKQLAAMGGSPSQNATANQSNTFSCSQITTNLFYGMNNDLQVKCLQEVLKSQGYAVAASGNYDLATKTAVTQFQQKYAGEILAPYHLTRGSGNVGNATRAKINQIIIQ